jgi:hypothetical protein
MSAVLPQRQEATRRAKRLMLPSTGYCGAPLDHRCSLRGRASSHSSAIDGLVTVSRAIDSKHTCLADAAVHEAVTGRQMWRLGQDRNRGEWVNRWCELRKKVGCLAERCCRPGAAGRMGISKAGGVGAVWEHFRIAAGKTAWNSKSARAPRAALGYPRAGYA